MPKCPHNRRKSRCKECKGGSICVHNCIRSQCKECKGGSICVHNRRKSYCYECKKYKYYECLENKDNTIPDIEENYDIFSILI